MKQIFSVSIALCALMIKGKEAKTVKAWKRNSKFA
jgi:hypothetical protein